MPALFSALAPPGKLYSPERLLDLIAGRFGNEDGFLAFKDFIQQHGIAAETWSL
ncbi:MAG: hypothetical protein ISS19_08165 [Bacteroidales bacterium]|nr:hypothetical protein [Bacteroidales bacterium]